MSQKIKRVEEEITVTLEERVTIVFTQLQGRKESRVIISVDPAMGKDSSQE